MSYYQYGGGDDMEKVFDSVCIGEGEHHEFLTMLNQEYVKLISSATASDKIDNEKINLALKKDGLYLMNIRMLYLVLDKLGGRTTATQSHQLAEWPLGKAVGEGAAQPTELYPRALADLNVTAATDPACAAAYANREGDDKSWVIKWGVPAYPYKKKWEVTDTETERLIQAAQQTASIVGFVNTAKQANNVPSDKWNWVKDMAGDAENKVAKNLYKLLNSFRNFIYLKNFVDKVGEFSDADLAQEYIKITCGAPNLGLPTIIQPPGLDMEDIFKTNLALMGLMEKSYINGPEDNQVFFTNQLDYSRAEGAANYHQLRVAPDNVAFSFGVNGTDALDILTKIYTKYGLTNPGEEGDIKKYAFHIFTLRNSTPGEASHPVAIVNRAAANADTEAEKYRHVFDSHFPYFCQEVEDIVSMRKALVDSVEKDGEGSVKILPIKACLKGMADTWGGSKGVRRVANQNPASTQAPLAAIKKKIADGDDLTDEEQKLWRGESESSKEVPVPLKTLEILNNFYEEYLSFTSLPTAESSYDEIESLVNNIYKALYDAHQSGVIVLTNPTEVSKIVKIDPRLKNGFSNKGTTMRLREYNKEARHITIRLVAKDSDNDYSTLPGHKSMYDTLKGDNFELLSKFTLQLFKKINLKPTDITEYFQNLGDTEIKKTNNSFEITYIVESQYSMLNLTKSGRTTELVERLRDDLRRIGKVNLEEFGGEYAITVLGREDKGKWHERGSGENVISESQLFGDSIIFKIEDKHFGVRNGSLIGIR